VALALGVAVASLLPVPVAVQAQARIFTCMLNGKKLTSDRPIPECNATGQRELRSDGSLKAVVPPTMTQEEKADQEAKQREAEARRNAEFDAIRRDRNLMSRFPNEAIHQKARDKSLDDARNAVKSSEARLAILKAERKPLLAEAEFYPPPKTFPAKLKHALDANDASQKAQAELIQNANDEVGRINSLYDVELAKLKRLWAGAPPGSLGPGGGVATVSTAAAATPLPALPAPSAPVARR
jgi:hypothetical protein